MFLFAVEVKQDMHDHVDGLVCFVGSFCGFKLHYKMISTGEIGCYSEHYSGWESLISNEWIPSNAIVCAIVMQLAAAKSDFVQLLARILHAVSL